MCCRAFDRTLWEAVYRRKWSLQQEPGGKLMEDANLSCAIYQLCDLRLIDVTFLNLLPHL